MKYVIIELQKFADGTVAVPPVNTAEIRSALDTYEGLSKTAQRAFWGFLVRRIIPAGEGFEITLVLP